MLRIILLLTPIYVTLFWSLVLNLDRSKRAIPQAFLGKFMLAAFIVYLSHFTFFSYFTTAYLRIDILYQYASLMVYPMFHIYVRLLTIDQRFSLKRHGKFIAIPTILVAFYAIGLMRFTTNEYKEFLFVRNASINLNYGLLSTVYYMIKVFGVLQIVYTVVVSHRLIVKYQDRAMQFYSDEDNSRVGKLKLQNAAMIVMGVTSLFLTVLGRVFCDTSGELWLIGGVSVIFSSMLFTVGWLGNKQSVINPTYETDEMPYPASELTETDYTQRKSPINSGYMKQRLEYAMTERKAYLDPKLTINDLARAMGTNRTSLSTYINNDLQQNFCTMVNRYRMQELEQLLTLNTTTKNEELAEACGFGSTDSMKRSIQLVYGCSFKKWKEQFAIGEQTIAIKTD